jgi:signal transduction histidine kinase
VRRIASELRPQVLDDLGLLAALEWQSREFERCTGATCRFRVKGEPGAIDADRSTALFRIFQEILTNVARHAGATYVQITLDVAARTVRLHVRDNGCGMQTVPGPYRKRLGLLGMQERSAEKYGSSAHRRRGRWCACRSRCRRMPARR